MQYNRTLTLELVNISYCPDWWGPDEMYDYLQENLKVVPELHTGIS